MSDLHYVVVRQLCLLTLTATPEYTTPATTQLKIKGDLARIDKWYQDNEMRRNHHKYQAMVMEKIQVNPVFSCENTVIPTGNELELLAVTVRTVN